MILSIKGKFVDVFDPSRNFSKTTTSSASTCVRFTIHSLQYTIDLGYYLIQQRKTCEISYSSVSLANINSKLY